jgi:dTDP-4-dehydrorhamnose reductase
LGTDVVRALRAADGYEVVPLRHEDVECTSSESVEVVLGNIRPGVVINCAAFVRVDECEERAEEAFHVNAIGALNVARTAARMGARCVYVSTDYVFEGRKGEPYTEDDVPCPVNVYGASKLAGEFLVRQSCPDWMVVRVASLFGRSGARGKGGNFVETVLRKARAEETLRVVTDTRMSPTYTVDAARALEGLVALRASGVFHLTNAGECTWYEFACKITELAGIGTHIEQISMSEYPTRARRPANSALRSGRLERLLKEVPRPWEEALRAYLREKGHAER